MAVSNYAQTTVRRFFRSAFSAAPGAATVPWFRQSVDRFFGAHAFGSGVALAPAPGASCGTGTAAPDEFFSEFNWD